MSKEKSGASKKPDGSLRDSSVPFILMNLVWIGLITLCGSYFISYLPFMAKLSFCTLYIPPVFMLIYLKKPANKNHFEALASNQSAPFVAVVFGIVMAVVISCCPAESRNTNDFVEILYPFLYAALCVINLAYLKRNKPRESQSQTRIPPQE